VAVLIVTLAYNEEKSIGLLLEKIEETLGSTEYQYRVIVINDGSKDRTPEIVKGMGSQMPVELVSHETNLGVGEAFKTGLRHAASIAQDRDTIITMEADNTNDATMIPKMVEEIAKGFDVVCASRYLKGGKYVGFPPYRLALSFFANLFMKVFFQIKGIRDYTIFYRAYRASLIKRALQIYGDSFINVKGFAANAQILVRLSRLGIKASEVPLVYRYDLKKSRSTVRVIFQIFEYLRLLVDRFSRKEETREHP